MKPVAAENVKKPKKQREYVNIQPTLGCIYEKRKISKLGVRQENKTSIFAKCLTTQLYSNLFRTNVR